MAAAFFPLDEELALPPNGVTPLIYQGLVLLGAYMPFEAASKTLSTLLKAQLSSSTVWRLTEQAGKDLQTWQDEQAAPLCEPTEKGPVSEQLVIETDGVLVPLRPNEWAEVKMVSIGEPKAGKEEAVHCSQLSYFARLTDADTFADVASGEMGRRGVEQAKAVAAVQDGADWIQGFVQGHRADALRILDFPHAAEYVTAIAELANGAGVQLPEHWLSQELHTLKHEGPTHTLQEVQRLSALAPVEGMAEKVAYLSKREGQMQYPLYQAAGWPIGSGAAESGNKLVVEARLKGPGMHWDRRRVNSMLALRTTLCSDRWPSGWQVIQAGWQHARRTRYQARWQAHLTRARTTLQQVLMRLPLPLLLALFPAPPRPVPAAPKGRTEAQRRWGRQTFSPRMLRNGSAKI